MSPDSITDNLYELYKDFKEDNPNDELEVKIRERLKQLNF